MKKKGFTLIELVVVVAIILLLAATLAPKLRKEVAKARDAKAVAALGAVRTATGVFMADEGKVPVIKASASEDALIASDGTSEYLENSVVSFVSDTTAGTMKAVLPVGGHNTSSTGATSSLSFGGDITLSGSTNSGDYVFAITSGDATGSYDTKGNAWASY